LGAGVTTVPLRGAHGTLHSSGIQKKHPEKVPLTFADVTLFFALVTQLFFFQGSVLQKK